MSLVFSGMGSQWPGMGKKLFKANEIFRQTITECEISLKRICDLSLIDFFTNAHDREPEIDTLQIIIFSIQLGILEILKRRGLKPSSVVGHSLGEISAAYAAGILSLDDAVRIVRFRSKDLARLRGRGTMLMVLAGAETLDATIKNLNLRVDISGYNAKNMTTVSGSFEDIQCFRNELERIEVSTATMNVDIPFHGRFIDELLAEFRKNIEGVTFRNAEIPFFSTVTGRKMEDHFMTVEYWLSNLRNPVLFYQAMSVMNEGQFFLEISPHAVLSGAVGKSCIKTLVRGQDDEISLNNTLEELQKHALLTTNRFNMDLTKNLSLVENFLLQNPGPQLQILLDELRDLNFYLDRA